jgi:hypothetical protein
MAPRRGTDELFHPLIVTVSDVIVDGFDILAALGAQQTAEVMPGMPDTVHALLDEMSRVALAEFHERRGNVPEWIRVMVIFLRRRGAPNAAVG